jgi:hypothetical protein
MPMGTPFPVATEDQLSPAARSIEDVHKQIIAMREEKPPVYVAPPVPAGIAEKTRLEIEEGRKRNAMALAERERATQPKKDPADGRTDPVYRPGDFVPNIDQGQIVSKSYKSL